MSDETSPPVWMLELGLTGIGLTQTFALSRSVVRGAVARWPRWFASELFGPPHREADVPPLTELRQGLRTTPAGRRLLDAPDELVRTLAADLGAGDPFVDVAATATIARLTRGPAVHDDLVSVVRSAVRRGGWATADGSAPSLRELSWLVTEIRCRGEGYGPLETIVDPAPPPRRRYRLGLTAAGRAHVGGVPASSARMGALVVHANLVGVRGVTARVAVREDQPLTALHDAIQEAFGWMDDHLYSFWLDGRFWGESEMEYTAPDVEEVDAASADVPIAELDLTPGQKIAYVFDFGDEWRVLLTVKEREGEDGGTYPRVLERRGEAPPQYGDVEDE